MSGVKRKARLLNGKTASIAIGSDRDEMTAATTDIGNNHRTSTSTSVPPPPPPFTSRHQEALDLELALLQATLRRNNASHRKTQYLRRLNMAVTSVLQTHRLHTVYSELNDVMRDVLHWKKELQQVRKRQAQSKKKQQIFWELDMHNESIQRQSSPSILSNKMESIQERLTDIFERSVVNGSMTEALSRLEYAASACWTEISRGFFLALVTVAVACVARIRSLLLRLQQHVVEQGQCVLLQVQASLSFQSLQSPKSSSNNSTREDEIEGIGREQAERWCTWMATLQTAISNHYNQVNHSFTSSQIPDRPCVASLDDVPTTALSTHLDTSQAEDEVMFERNNSWPLLSNPSEAGTSAEERRSASRSYHAIDEDAGETMTGICFDDTGHCERLDVTAPLAKTTTDTSVVSGIIDHNAAILAKVKKQKGNVSKRKISRDKEHPQPRQVEKKPKLKATAVVGQSLEKAAAGTSTDASSTTSPSSKNPSVKKRRKEKKRKKDGVTTDFFDQLFGS